MNTVDLCIQAGDRAAVFVPDRERARRRAQVLRQLALGRRRRKQYRESAA
ncbi:hypothetical protein ABZW30_18770 [Kitasatospora sp. NPDC004669]